MILEIVMGNLMMDDNMQYQWDFVKIISSQQYHQKM